MRSLGWKQLFVAAGLVAGGMQSAQAAVVQNAGFENGSGSTIESWAQWGNARIEPWAARTGTNGLAMYGWTSGGGVFQDVPAAGVSNYTFSAYGFRDAGFPTQLVVEMKLEFKKTNDTTLATVSKTVNGSASWTQQTVSAVSPQGTEKVRMTLLFGGTAGAGGAYKFDDVSLSSTAATTPTNTHYVAPLGGNIYPYTNWATAARSIQDAVYAAGNGDLVLVTNGTYTLATQITVDRSITVRGINGASNTVVNGNAQGRCFFIISNNTRLEGLTISNGYANIVSLAQGGGVYSTGTGNVMRACTVRGNRAYGAHYNNYWAGTGQGGGVYGRGLTVADCLVEGNTASAPSSMYPGAAAGGGLYLAGGYVSNSIVRHNVADGGGLSSRGESVSEGGGMYLSNVVVSRCMIVSNEAKNGSTVSYGTINGGGLCVSSGRLENCLIAYNASIDRGGGVHASGTILRHCTVVANQLYGPDGGGVYLRGGALFQNSIAYFNASTNGGAGANLKQESTTADVVEYSCTSPGVGGVSNITYDPLFVDRIAGNFRLAQGSPCGDVGKHLGSIAFTNDLVGARRPVDNDGQYNSSYDLGCYESQDYWPTNNLLLDPSMETDSVWIRGGDMAFEPWAARTGSRGLAMYGWTGNGGLAYQDIPAGAATSYSFGVWCTRDTNFSVSIHKPTLKIEFLTSSYTLLGANTNELVGFTGPFMFEAVAANKPAGAAIIRVVMIFNGGAVSGGAYKFDDARLVAGRVISGARAAVTTEKVSEPEEQPGETTTEPVPTTEPVVTAPVTVIPVVKPVAAAVAPASSDKPAGVTFGGQAGLVVVTSDDLGLENLGMPAVDGNPRTAWKGEADAGGWWIAVQYPETIRARSVKLQLAKGSLANAQVLYSTDAKTWADLGAALKAGKVDLKYLWVIFPDDGSGAVPVVKEISIKAAK